MFLWTGLCQAVQAPEEWDRAVHFADLLMLQQRFRESEVEYERLAATHPDHPARLKILQRMFDAAMATQDYSFTLTLARAWEQELQGTAVCLPLSYQQQALYQWGNYPAVLKQGFPPGCDQEMVSQNIYRRGLSRLHLRAWPEARQEFDRIPALSSLNAQARAASQQSVSGPLIPQKSPALAAGLNAIVPGSGYLYANRPQTAAACLVVNGLFIWGTVASIHAREPGLAALLSLFSFGWYFGGVMGSAQAAQKENQSRLSAFIEPFEIAH
jgi:hypothetical protein